MGGIIMQHELINTILNSMSVHLSDEQLRELKSVLYVSLSKYEISDKGTELIAYDDSNMRFWDRYELDRRLSGMSEETLKNYKLTVTMFLSTVNKPIKEYKADDIFNYLELYKKIRNVKLSRLKNMQSALSSFFSWLHKKNYIEGNPVAQLDSIKLPKKIKIGFSDEERELLKLACNNTRDTALIEFLYSTGVRVSEAVRLNREDVNFTNRDLIVFGKGSKERITYINPAAAFWLQKYLNERDDDNPALFVSLYSPHERLTKKGVEDLLHRIGKRAGVSNVHPHRFRRTCATNALNRGMPLEQVAQLLGHEKLDTTKIYCTVNQENVKASHAKYLCA